MKRAKTDVTAEDLFSAAAGAEAPESTALIVSPLVAETAGWLENRAKTLGSLLASERAVEYVAILRAFVKFREGHEPEPLHEDLSREVCGEDAAPDAESLFKGDIRQLKEWELVTERIEKERLRGYRDNKRKKFRYRLCEDAVAFVAWLAERRASDISPEGGDVTGNLLDMQCSLLHELRRRLRTVDGEAVSYETAGDILYRVEQMHAYVEATAKTLQALNLRLLGFGVETFDADEAKAIVSELGVFLDRFGRRFGPLREEIAADLAELSKPTQERRWTACVERLKTESARFRRIASVRIPDPQERLADATGFYAPDGRLVSLMSRVGDSARRVWGKLNAKLRELERRNHRLEGLGARLADLSAWPEEDVPYDWLRGLLATASMRAMRRFVQTANDRVRRFRRSRSGRRGRASSPGSRRARLARRPMSRPLNRRVANGSRAGCGMSASIRPSGTQFDLAADAMRRLTIAAALSTSSRQRAWVADKGRGGILKSSVCRVRKRAG